MVYAISAGVSMHDPGPVTRGLLKDLGWTSIPSDFDPADCDVDGSDLAALIADTLLLDLATFAQNFAKSACL
jgi:hypothetical protein